MQMTQLLEEAIMSADNGIYILRTLKWSTKEGSIYLNPIKDQYEYRVVHCQDIESVYNSDLSLVIQFGSSQIYDKEGASQEANRLSEEVEWTEYGVCGIHKDICFPNITREAAMQALDCYVGASPVKASNEILVEIEVLGGVAEVVNDGVEVKITTVLDRRD